MEIIKTLHVKFFPFGSSLPNGMVTVNDIGNGSGSERFICFKIVRDEPVNGPLLLRTDFRNTDYIIK